MRFRTLAITAACLFTTTASAEQWITYNATTTALESNEIHAICIDNLGAKWLGTADGLTRYDGSTWTTYKTTENLAHNNINSISFEVTSYGPEIWVATDGGVSVISVVPDAITFATPYRKDNTGLISNMVNASEVDGTHVKWFGTDNGVSSFDGHEWASYTTEDFLPLNDVLSIDTGPDSTVYYGTNGAGVARYDGLSGASPYDTDWTGIASDTVTAIYIDSQGVKWFGTDQGLSSHVGNETKEGWTTYTTDQGLANNYVRAIAEDIYGALWIGTDGGASRLDNAVWTTFTTAEGLGGPTVYSIAVETNGNVWFGTNGGVSVYNSDAVSVENSAPVAPTLTVNGAFPNPFNPTTTIMFTLPGDGFTELAVFNTAGQRVKTLVSDELVSGVHTVQWNGTNDAGERVASGIYISRLVMNGQSAAGRMVLVK